MRRRRKSRIKLRRRSIKVMRRKEEKRRDLRRRNSKVRKAAGDGRSGV